jgi:hypothetical protein
MKININHGEAYLDGYINLERRNGIKTDQLVEDYVIKSINGRKITEIVSHPGALEQTKATIKETIDSWSQFSDTGCVLKIKIVDVVGASNALAYGVIDTPGFNSMFGGYHVYLDQNSLKEALESSGFSVTKTWYGPYQWVVNMEAVKQ